MATNGPILQKVSTTLVFRIATATNEPSVETIVNMTATIINPSTIIYTTSICETPLVKYPSQQSKYSQYIKMIARSTDAILKPPFSPLLYMKAAPKNASSNVNFTPMKPSTNYIQMS